MIRLNTLARTSILAGLVTGGLALSAPAFAADDDAPPHAAMSVKGVDFTSPHAIEHLKHQLKRVAQGICMPNTSGHVLYSPDELACYAAAVKNGMAQIDSREQEAVRDHTIRFAASRADATSAN